MVALWYTQGGLESHPPLFKGKGERWGGEVHSGSKAASRRSGVGWRHPGMRGREAPQHMCAHLVSWVKGARGLAQQQEQLCAG